MNFNWHKGSMIGEDGTHISFFFNPSLIKISKETRWNVLEAAGREQGVHQYGCGDPRRIEFELDLTRAGGDTYTKDTVEKLLEMTKPKIKGAGVDRPPKVHVLLGDAFNADCVIDSVNATYGPLYNPQSLNPYMGKVTVRLSEIKE